MKPRFHRLRVTAIEEVTPDSVALSFAVPPELQPDYDFQAGQHLTIRLPEDEVRRSYSICSAAGSGVLRIGVKRLPGGAFSEVRMKGLEIGDELDVMTPMGRFGLPLADSVRPGFVAAGSGITPVLTMVTAALARAEVEEVTVIDCNRTQREVMFLEELADLKDRHLARLQLVHVLTREPQDSELLTGRLDVERFREIHRQLVANTDHWFLCGPFDLVTAVHDGLLLDGVEAGSVHTELFHAEALARRVDIPVPAGGTAVTATLDGKQSRFDVAPGEHVLDALLRVRGDAPYACKGGVCGTCRARLTEGEVAMDANWALEPEEIERGYVLTCQSRPVSSTLTLDYDG